MLREGLQNSGHYNAVWAQSGSEALQAVVEQNFDMVIIDVGLTDMNPATLVSAIRDTKNGIKIMLIPLIGQDLSDGLKSLKVDGILPKPFFVGDLPDLVDKALGRVRQRTPTPAPIPLDKLPPKKETPDSDSPKEAETETPAPDAPGDDAYAAIMAIPEVPQETIRFLRANESEVLRLLGDLNVEVRAEAILLIAGGDLIAHSGMLSREQCQDLALLVAQSSQAAAEAAAFLGERAGRFTQSLHEGGSYRLYTLTLSEGILLSLALSTNVPLGMIRHQSRQVAEQLTKYII